MAVSGCHLTAVYVRLRSLLLLFILPVCNFVPWLLVDGSMGTAAVGIQSNETDFQTFRMKSNYPFSVINNLAPPPEPMDPICQVLINNFTECSVLYTRCIIQNAKTYKRCQRCVDEYLAVDTSYRLLRLEQPNNSTPGRCTEIYPGMEEVNVFWNVFHFVQKSWNAGGCQNCFSWFDINSSKVGKLTKTAETFLNMSESFLACIFNESIVYKLQISTQKLSVLAFMVLTVISYFYISKIMNSKPKESSMEPISWIPVTADMMSVSGPSWPDDRDVWWSLSKGFLFRVDRGYYPKEDGSSNLLLDRVRNVSNITICTRCKGFYIQLNEYYVSKFETLFDKDAVICMDISDLMNFTRYMWQELYKCPIQRASAWPVIVASVVMCCLPVGFYIATKVFGHDVERKMVHQKRLRRRSGGSSAFRSSTSSVVGNHLSM